MLGQISVTTRRMTKVVFGCAAITIVIFVIASSVTSLLAQNSTQPRYGTEYNESSSYQNEMGYEDHSKNFEPKKDSTLILVQVIFRHGDRSPISSYPTDIHKDDWPQGYGQLTQLGMIQGYQLGQFLRKRYSGFLEHGYQPEEVYIRSTNKDRSIMTAQSVAAGLFLHSSGLTESWPFGQWQPVSIHTVPEKWDTMLYPTKACQYVKELKYGLKAYFYSKQNMMKDKGLMFALSGYSGLAMNFTTLYSLGDTIFCQKVHNMSQPKWMRKYIEDELLSFHKLLPIMMPEDAKYLSGILLETMINNMLSKAHKALDKHKLYLYSAHEGNIHSLLSLLGVFHKKTAIPYAAALMLELHRINHKLYVKLLYRTYNDSSTMTLNVPGCKDNLCPLGALSAIFDEPAQKSWEEVCGVAKREEVIDFGENTIPILVAVLVVFIGLDIFLLYKTCIYHQRLHRGDRKEEYSLVRTNGGSSSDSEDDLVVSTKNHRRANKQAKNGNAMNSKNHRRHDNEHGEESDYKETSLFIAPSLVTKGN